MKARKLFNILGLFLAVALGYFFFETTEKGRHIFFLYNSYIEVDKQNKLTPEHKIGFLNGFSKERRIPGKELYRLFNDSITPIFHEDIITGMDFYETLFFFFTKGVEAHYFTTNEYEIISFDRFRTLFNLIEEELMSIEKDTEHFGGYGSFMASQVMKEGGSPVIIASAGEEVLDILFQDEDFKNIEIINTKIEKENDTEVDPNTLNLEEMKNHDNERRIVIQYGKLAELNDIKSPMNNFFAFTLFVNKTEQTEERGYLAHIKDKNISKHVFGDLNHYEILSDSERISILRILKTQLQQIKEDEKNTVHIEFSSFHDKQFYDSVLENIIKSAHSIGINEIQFTNLITYFQERKFERIGNNLTGINDAIEKINYLIHEFYKRKYEVSRIHAHLYNQHVLCYDETKWEDGFVSLVKGIVADVKYYSNNDDFAVQNFRYKIPRNYTSFNENVKSQVNYTFSDKIQQFNTTSNGIKNINLWELDENWKCVFGIRFHSFDSVTIIGVRETISAAALAFHNRKL